MSSIYAIDPGTTKSAFVLVENGEPRAWNIIPNGDLLDTIRNDIERVGIDYVAVEKIEPMGMAIGNETMATIMLTGRIEEIMSRKPQSLLWIPRRKVKLHLCGTMKAKDPNIRQALIDRFGGTAETKRGGKLYRLASHCWAALAVGVVAYDELNAKAGAA